MTSINKRSSTGLPADRIAALALGQRSLTRNTRRRFRARLASSYELVTRCESKLSIELGKIQNSRGKDYIIRSSQTDVKSSETNGQFGDKRTEPLNGHLRRQKVLTLDAKYSIILVSEENLEKDYEV